MRYSAVFIFALAAVSPACDDEDSQSERTSDECTDLSDNDRDGFVDCEDSDCWNLAVCGGGDADADADSDADSDGDVPRRFQPLIEAIEWEQEELGAPGVAVAVIEGGEVVFAAGFGSRHPREDVPVEATTLFRIASVTKMLTAVGLLQLVEDGVVDLDAPITDYLTEFSFARDPSWASSITVEQLLTHSSGIVDYIEVDGARDDSALESYLNGRFGEVAYLMAPSGRMYNYTNPGYMLAGLITETVGGSSYRTYLRENVFAPLGMDRTYFLPAEVETDDDYAVAEMIDWETGAPTLVEPDTYDNAWARPAGYAYSSVLDLARFVAFLRDGDTEVLGEAEHRAMQSPQVDTEMFLDLMHYGYGLVLSQGGYYGPGMGDFYEIDVIRHDGALPGFSSELYYVPELDLGFVTLANASGAYFYYSFATALHTLADMPSAVAGPGLEMTRAELETYVGDYLDPLNVGHVTVSLEGSRLNVFMPDVEAGGVTYNERLTPLSPRNFQLEIGGLPLQVTFIPDEEGNGEYLRTRYFVAEGVVAGADPKPRPSGPPQGLDRMLRTLRQLPRPPSLFDERFLGRSR